MKVGLMGFGKTGKAVARILLAAEDVELRWVARRSPTQPGRSAAGLLDVDTDSGVGHMVSTQDISAGELLQQQPVDVIVDFSSPEGIAYYGEEAARRGISIVSAVSQYPAETLERIGLLARRTRVIHSPNITLGINFLLISARILRHIAPHTDIEIIEEHFKTKPEVSGTARIIARHLDIEDESIKSVRAGGIIGTHEILFGFPYQTIRLKHESISREAFGNGVLFALANLPRRRTGLYSMEDLLLPYFRHDRGSREGRRPWWKLW